MPFRPSVLIRSPFARRRLLLFLAAILLPSGVVLVVGSRLIVQGRELAARRREDARRNAIVAIRQTLLARLEAARLRELSTTAAGQRTPTEPYADTSVALAARVESAAIVLPWRDDSSARAFSHERDEPAFAALIAEARRDSLRAAATYARARRSARTASQAAYAALMETHTLRGTERLARLSELSQRPMGERDEFGVPFALYAARALRHDAADSGAVARAVDRAARELLPLRVLSPTACYLLRELAGGARGIIDGRCRELDAAERLVAEGVSVAGPVSADTPSWTYWPSARWFVSSSAVGAARMLVAVRAPNWVLSAGDGAEPLGPAFPGAFVRLPPEAGQPTAERAERIFYVGVLLVVVVFATTSAGLLWRDVRREVATASMRARFVRGVTHELKTPLAAIRMYAETMRDRPGISAATRDDYLDTIVGESERLTRLLENVLDLSQIERGAKSYRLVPVSLIDVVRRVSRTMEHPLHQQGFTLDVTVPDGGDVAVNADADALEQALLNLVTNAMKYSGDQRQITLTLSYAGEDATVDVTDNGVGIAESEHDKIFEEFYRVPASENSGVTGAGLGLTIVRHVAQAHGGRVSVRSGPGHGSTFTLHLPLLIGGSEPARSGTSLTDGAAKEPIGA